MNYDNISNSGLFSRPKHSGHFVLKIPRSTIASTTRFISGTTTVSTSVQLKSASVATQKVEYDENRRLYNEYQAVEQALCGQITSAIRPEYPNVLRNPDIDMINNTIPDSTAFF